MSSEITMISKIEKFSFRITTNQVQYYIQADLAVY